MEINFVKIVFQAWYSGQPVYSHYFVALILYPGHLCLVLESLLTFEGQRDYFKEILCMKLGSRYLYYLFVLFSNCQNFN